MNAQYKEIGRVAGLSLSALMLVSCGGGDEPGKCYSPTGAVCSAVGVPRSLPEPNSSITGLYRGLTSSGRTFDSLVLDDNSFYAIYSQANNPLVAAGAIQGTVRTDKADFTITDAVDFNLEGLGTRPVGVTGTYGEKQFLKGLIAYPPSTQGVSFSANYSADFEVAPQLSTVAGRYAGTSAIPGGAETITLDIDNNGNIAGRASSGCVFSGAIKPRTSGNAYTVTIAFGAAPCRFPGAQVNGISYFDRTSKLAYTIASLPGQTASFIAISAKQ